jgi:uncharacterized protein (DUF433 family)
VDFLLGLFASGRTHEEVLDSYPQLSGSALGAAFALATEAVREESSAAVPTA